MKVVMKKLTAVLMAAVLLLSAVACGKDGKKKQIGRIETNTESDEDIYAQMIYEEGAYADMVYAGENFEVEGLVGNVQDFVVKKDKLYFKVSEDNIAEKYYSSNIDGTDLKEIKVPSLMSTERMNSFLVNDDNTYTFLTSFYREGHEGDCYNLFKIDEKGNVIYKKEVTKEMNLPEEAYVSKTVVDSKGNMLVITDYDMVLFNAEGEFIDKLTSPHYLEAAATTKNGEVVCGYVGEEGAVAQIFDIENKKWGKKYALNISDFPYADVLINGVEYDFYYKDNSGIYGYDFSKQKMVKLIDFLASSLLSTEYWCIYPIGNEKMLGTVYDEGYNVKLMLYSKVAPEKFKEKQIITVGTLSMPDGLQKAAFDFNKKNTDYLVTFRDYSKMGDPEAKMNADIITGNIPDVLALYDCPTEQYIAKGVFEDLIPYFENDSELSTEDLLPSAFEAMKTGDKLYWIAPEFNINSVIGKTEDVGGKSGWTFEEMNAVINQKGKDVRPFLWQKKTEILNIVFADAVLDYVDWQTGECNFECQDFKDILAFCNRGTDEKEEQDEDESLALLIQEGELLFKGGYVRMEDLQTYRKLYNADICPIGYPCDDRQGSYFVFDHMVGVSSKSEVKEGAWEFIRTFATNEYYRTQDILFGIPIRNDCYEMMIREKTTTESYVDEYGKEVSPWSMEGEIYGTHVQEGPVPEEDELLFRQLVENTTKKSNYNPMIMQIVEEEAKAYFAGDKDVDETAKIIQNRVTTYINEVK